MVVVCSTSQSIIRYQLISNLASFSGHINHSLFWKNLAPAASENKGNGGTLKDGPLKDAIVASFGSLDNLKKEFNATTAGIQGSGWGWLVSNILRTVYLLVNIHDRAGMPLASAWRSSLLLTRILS